jgi:hypothetical protein
MKKQEQTNALCARCAETCKQLAAVRVVSCPQYKEVKK